MYLFRIPILTGIGNLLIVQDQLEPSDLIFVLNGDIATRPFQVAKLVQRGLSDKDVIVRAADSLASAANLYPNITELSIAMMIRAGIPQSSIIQLPQPKGVASTFEEAEALHSYVREHPLKRVIVVTSAIHTRRAGWIITRTLSDAHIKFMMSPAPDPRYNSHNWWRQEDGFLGYEMEYTKLAYYLLKYR